MKRTTHFIILMFFCFSLTACASVTYLVTPENGNATLSCTSPDEETILLTDAGESIYGDTTITLKPGTTSFFLSGTDVSCNLSLSIKDITMSNVTAINDQVPDL